MNTANIIKSLRVARSYTQKQLADMLGTSEVTIQNWESSAKNPSMPAIINLSKTLGVSTDYLLGITHREDIDRFLTLSDEERILISDYRLLDYYGRRAVSEICSIEKDRTINSHNENGSTCRKHIPLYTTPSAAGYSDPLDNDDYETIPIDESVPKNADFAVKIQGDSMIPYIYDDDIVFVQRNAPIQNGDVGIFCVNGAMYCKHYYLDASHNITLVSSNPECQLSNVFIGADSDISLQYFGRVILDKKPRLPKYFTDHCL